MTSTDAVFAGSIPALYDRLLGPLRAEIEVRGRLEDAVAAAAAALAPFEGSDAPMSAHVFSAA